MATDESQRSDQKGVSLEDAMQAVVRAAIANLHTALPGIIQSFNATTQTARVTPAVKRVWLDEGPLPLPDCVDVPVQFPGGGGFVLTWPVSPGDECLLVFSERAIDAWFARGGVQEPSVVAFHDLSDAFALMGFRSKPHAIHGLFAGGAELRTLDGQTVVRVESGMVTAGNPAAAAAAVRADILSTILTAISAHTHILAGTSPPGGGPIAGTATPSLELATLPDPSARNVKVS